MKFKFLIVLLAISFVGLATPRVFFNYKVYYTVDHDPYVETAIQFSSGTIKYLKNESGNLQANLEITQIFKKDEEIITADKYLLSSPEMVDSVVEDFYDVRRFLLNSGNYSFELVIKDLNSQEKVEGDFKIEVPPLKLSQITCSEVEFIQSLSKTQEKDNFTKNGYRLIPYFTNYFPPVYDKIMYYMELYNSDNAFDADEPFAVTFQVKDVASGEILEDYFQYKKLKPAKIIPVINILPVEQLPSGEYELIITVMDKEQSPILEKQVDFKRRNNLPEPIIDMETIDIARSFANEISDDSIHYFLGSLMPISERHEYEQIREMFADNDTARMKKFFHLFWKRTAPHNTYEEWVKYKKQVEYAEKIFGTQIRSGYESDRGRVHLKYGSPNFITDQPDDANAYPYQIWHYYKIGNQSNVRFVFYNPDMVTNEYPLLHSDLRGEIKNTNWKYEILKRNNANTDIDQRNSGIYFEN